MTRVYLQPIEESDCEQVIVTGRPQQETAFTRLVFTGPVQDGMLAGLQPSAMLVGVVVKVTVQMGISSIKSWTGLVKPTPD